MSEHQKNCTNDERPSDMNCIEPHIKRSEQLQLQLPPSSPTLLPSVSMVEEEKVNKCGMSLVEIASLATNIPGVQQVIRWHSFLDHTDNKSNHQERKSCAVTNLNNSRNIPNLTEFRNVIVAGLLNSNIRLVLNYDMTKIGLNN